MTRAAAQRKRYWPPASELRHRAAASASAPRDRDGRRCAPACPSPWHMPKRLAALLRSGLESRWRDPALGIGMAAVCLFEYLVIRGAASDPDPPIVALVVLC